MATTTQPPKAGAGQGGENARVPSREEMLARLAARRSPEQQVQTARRKANTVQVWPHLMMRQFLAAVVVTLNTLLLAVLINGPLDALANPEKTPNPSKAPWYFLNLQELLLHMSPDLAGVIIPTLALVAIAAIPYFDNKPEAVGVWFYSRKGIPITVFTFIFTFIAEIALVLIDAQFPAKTWFANIVNNFGFDSATQGVIVQAFAGYIYPLAVIFVLTAILVFILLKVWKANKTEIIIGLFTGFVASYTLLTIIGTAFRGPSMALYYPWAMPASHLPPSPLPTGGEGQGEG